MFKRIKRKVLLEVLYELEYIYNYYALETEEKKHLDEYNDFELGIITGLRIVKEKIHEILYKYE